MKYSQAQFESFLQKPTDKIIAVLFYGTNAGLVADNTSRLIKKLSSGQQDPFVLAEIDNDKIKECPSIIVDEASSIGLFGERRLIKYADAGNSTTKLIKPLLELKNLSSLTILNSDSLNKSSSLRSLFEAADNAFCVACYDDNASDIPQIISSYLTSENKQISRDTLNFLAQNLSSDRLVSKSELEKLVLYVGDKTEIEINDVIACCGDASAVSMDELIYAVADGNLSKAQISFDKLLSEGTNPVGITRALINHFQKLLSIKAKTDGGMPLSSAMNSLIPRLFFDKETSFKNQVSFWQDTFLVKALNILQQAEIDCKTTDMPDVTMCNRAILQISTAAQSQRKKRR